MLFLFWYGRISQHRLDSQWLIRHHMKHPSKKIKPATRRVLPLAPMALFLTGTLLLTNGPKSDMQKDSSGHLWSCAITTCGCTSKVSFFFWGHSVLQCFVHVQNHFQPLLIKFVFAGLDCGSYVLLIQMGFKTKLPFLPMISIINWLSLKSPPLLSYLFKRYRSYTDLLTGGKTQGTMELYDSPVPKDKSGSFLIL